MKKQVYIYTDGACSGNPGPGGYGAILRYKNSQKEISGGEKSTTNNRMELTGVIKALEALKEPCRVRLYTDSQYIVNAVNNGWVKRWRDAGWMRNKKEPAQNSDLWERVLELLEIHEVEFFWVKGHAENEFNNRCDTLAVAEANKYSAI
jgi:ribonuclease HI